MRRFFIFREIGLHLLEKDIYSVIRHIGLFALFDVQEIALHAKRFQKWAQQIRFRTDCIMEYHCQRLAPSLQIVPLANHSRRLPLDLRRAPSRSTYRCPGTIDVVLSAMRLDEASPCEAFRRTCARLYPTPRTNGRTSLEPPSSRVCIQSVQARPMLRRLVVQAEITSKCLLSLKTLFRTVRSNLPQSLCHYQELPASHVMLV